MKTLMLAAVAACALAGPAMAAGETICHIAVDDSTAQDTPSLNLRTGPGVSFQIVGDMENEQHVVVLGDRDGRWIHVYSPDLKREGWIAAKTARGRPYIDGCFRNGNRDPYDR